jgi:hypothetical protein
MYRIGTEFWDQKGEFILNFQVIGTAAITATEKAPVLSPAPTRGMDALTADSHEG